MAGLGKVRQGMARIPTPDTVGRMKRRTAILSIPGAAAAAAAAPAAEPGAPSPETMAKIDAKLLEPLRPSDATLLEMLEAAEGLARTAIKARDAAYAADGPTAADSLDRRRAIAAADRAIQRVIDLDKRIETIGWERHFGIQSMG